MARSGWGALAVTVAARAVLVTALSLIAWSLLPALLGWHSTVVMTGSMMPRLAPGDLVVSRPVDAAQLHVGEVLLVDDPDHAGRLRLHRLDRFAPDGRLILRGDANPAPDSTPVETSAVHGVASLRVPDVARPVIWLRQGRIAPLVVTAIVVLVLFRLSFWWRPDVDADESEPPAPPRRRRLLAAGTGAVVMLALGTATAHGTTKYTRTTNNSADTWRASTWFTCLNAVKGDGAASALPLSESSGTTAADVSGNGANGTYSSTGVTYGVTGPCTRDSRTAVTLDGTAGKIVGGGSPGNTAMTFEVLFKATGTHGGVIMSLLNNGGQSKVALAMTSTGTLTFANGSSSAQVSTTTTYNNNAWHLAVATVGTSGMALYVDTAAAITSNASTGVAGNNATVNIGYGKASTLGTGSNDYFQGSLAFATWYAKALTATQVAAHYNAAS